MRLQMNMENDKRDRIQRITRFMSYVYRREESEAIPPIAYRRNWHRQEDVQSIVLTVMRM